jgi:hypothetical protein
VRAAAAAGGAPAVVVAVSSRGQPALRAGAGGAIVGCRVVGDSISTITALQQK